jgi:hypothetical protein
VKRERAIYERESHERRFINERRTIVRLLETSPFRPYNKGNVREDRMVRIEKVAVGKGRRILFF